MTQLQLEIFQKTLFCKYHRYMPSTIFTQNINEIKRFFKNIKIIIKPIHGYSGNDILLLSKLNLKLINKKT